LIRCYTALQALKEAKARYGSDVVREAEEEPPDDTGRWHDLLGKFNQAMDDDFNTAQALGHVFDAARQINQIIAASKKTPAPALLAQLDAATGAFTHFGEVLGVFQSDPDEYFLADRSIEVTKSGLDVSWVERMIAKRQKAREDKDWTLADDIRKELAQKNILLKDSAGRTVWTVG
jgi:cysteinyl-tRNA synthetase